MNNKDLINQYVDTGLKIPEHQFNKLSNNQRGTYLRKRAMGRNVSIYELRAFTEEQRSQYIDKLTNNVGDLELPDDFNRTSDEERMKFMDYVLAKGASISFRYRGYLTDEQNRKNLVNKVNNGRHLTMQEINELPEDLKQYYLTNAAKDKYDFQMPNDIASLDEKSQAEFIDYFLSIGGSFKYFNRGYLNDTQNYKNVMNKLRKGNELHKDDFPLLSQEQKTKYIDYLLGKEDIDFDDSLLPFATEKQQMLLMDKVFNARDLLTPEEVEGLEQEEPFIFKIYKKYLRYKGIQ